MFVDIILCYYFNYLWRNQPDKLSLSMILSISGLHLYNIDIISPQNMCKCALIIPNPNQKRVDGWGD